MGRNSSERVRFIGDDLIEVEGPAVVRTAGSGDYEITTDLKLKFKRPCEVWLKVDLDALEAGNGES